MRYRNRKTLFPGVKLNISRRGLSTTLGIPGASINLGKKGAFLNTGIPGTGLYDRKKIGGKRSSQRGGGARSQPQPQEELLSKEWLSTENAELVTTPGLQGLRDTLLNCFQEKRNLEKSIHKEKRSLSVDKAILVLSYLLIFGFFFKYFRQNVEDGKENLKDLEEQFAQCAVNINFELEQEGLALYKDIVRTFKGLMTTAKIWDITAIKLTSSPSKRSRVVSTLVKKPVQIGFCNFEIIKSSFEAFHFPDTRGSHLYFYPGFLAIVDKEKKFGIVDLKELEFSYENVDIPFTDTLPYDALMIGSTWARANKDGTRDKRFRENYEIPLVRFGRINLKTPQGLNEAFLFSSIEKCENFAKKFLRFKNSMV
jgi:hypothetical protein